ncbi:hypothetical protein [Hymenobacter canadensis]|uniref:Peptidoglycan endopeptidase n=1 Tax=Hymenobacter canadensis TaxID=2999067 RepID=A0ABY7LT90_9BACT|nr:hypothetical protein [Hymenobacter canadensis]WBA42430.1 hypothetical protein O3303_02465 [Hymenobacter canadensis]
MLPKYLPLLLALLTGACHAEAPAAGSGPTETRPDPAAAAEYKPRVTRLAARRTALAARYRQARTATQKAAALQQARQLLVASLDTVIWPAWYGTPWAFYGTTQQPRQDSIACGYFVTTTLRDAGLRLDRVALAKTTSEKLIQNLTDEAHIRRYRLVPQARFVQQVQQLGDGLYIVGLDFHVGFLRVRQGQVRFIHSTYLGEGQVVNEDAATSAALRSKYRVVGRISADARLLESWLRQRRFVFGG